MSYGDDTGYINKLATTDGGTTFVFWANRKNNTKRILYYGEGLEQLKNTQKTKRLPHNSNQQ